MSISAQQVKELREKTGSGLMECKKALQEADGDLEEAITILRKKGQAAAEKKSGRSTSEGAIGSYIHTGGRIGVLIEVNCETDFVANTDEFKEIVRELAMHVAAAAPAPGYPGWRSAGLPRRQPDRYTVQQRRFAGRPGAPLPA